MLPSLCVTLIAPRSKMTKKQDTPLISGDVVEEVAPVLEISFANAVAMGDYSTAAKCHLGWMSVDSQFLQHAFIRVSSDPG